MRCKLSTIMATVSLIALISSTATEQAEASGFQIREQSGSALGNAFAGSTSGVDDISHMFFNPASLAYHEGTQNLSAVSFIFPSSQFKNGAASTISGVPITDRPDFRGDNDSGTTAVVPALYGMMSYEDLRLGFGISAPYGLVTENDDGWIGRYHALDSRLTTILVNPTAAYAVNDWFSVGGGVQIIYASTRLANSIDIGTIGAASGIPGSVPTMQDGRATVRGDDWGFGYNFGVMIEPIERVRVGLAYRSEVSLEATGDADFDLSMSGTTGAALQSSGLFVNTGFSADLDLPATASAGVTIDVTDKVSVMGEAAWTQWSSFKDLVIDFDNPAQPNSFTEEDWNDSWFFALGLTYRPTETYTMRFGVAYDQTPVPDRTRTPRVPDEDRYWMAVGADYDPTDWLSISLGYTHIFLPEASINLLATDPGNTFRGNLSGDYDSNIDIVTLQGTITF